jgi:NTE family protein
MPRPRIARLLIVPAICLVLLAGCAPTQVRPEPQRQARIALVLGAGAAKGFAHVGVLKVLESSGVPVDLIVGTSAGSAVGALYASGMDAYSLQKLALGVAEEDLVDLGFPDTGFIKGERLEAFINKTLGNAPIEKLKIPFYAVATDIATGQEVVFGKGNAGTAVRASCAIPGIFRTVTIGEKTYIDGGAVSPVPVDAARRYGADVAIAVDISGGGEMGRPKGTIDTILQAVTIMYRRLGEAQLTRADVVIRPDVGGIGSGDLTRRHDAIMEGEKAAHAAMPAIRALLDRLRAEGRLPAAPGS